MAEEKKKKTEEKVETAEKPIEDKQEVTTETVEVKEEVVEDKPGETEVVPADEEPVEDAEAEVEETPVAIKEAIPDFRAGDTIKVNYKIIEGDKTRIQPFQGIVIARKGVGISKTFTVRKISVDTVGVERIFPLNSPNIDSVKVIKRGSVRRAKLYYLRDRIGKQATRIKEKH